MQKTCYSLLLSALVLGLTAATAFAQNGDGIKRQRLGQAGMKFLSLSVDARAAALGDAVTAQGGSAMAIFYNPSGLAFIDGAVHAGLGRVAWIGDITYNVGSVAFRPAGGRYGVFGVSVAAVDYGDVPATIRADNPDGFLHVGEVSPSGLAAGLAYARMLTDRFAVGGQAKYVRQSLGSSIVRYEGNASPTDDHEQTVAAFDFGVLYRTGFRSLNFAVGVRNFAREVTYAQDSFELPLTMRIGFSMDMMDLMRGEAGRHALLLAVDAERARDYPEQLKAGLEYGFADVLALRAGYVYPTDEQGINLGFGLQAPVQGFELGIDYAYTAFGTFGSVNRFGLVLGF